MTVIDFVAGKCRLAVRALARRGLHNSAASRLFSYWAEEVDGADELTSEQWQKLVELVEAFAEEYKEDE